MYVKHQMFFVSFGVSQSGEGKLNYGDWTCACDLEDVLPWEAFSAQNWRSLLDKRWDFFKRTRRSLVALIQFSRENIDHKCSPEYSLKKIDTNCIVSFTANKHFTQRTSIFPLSYEGKRSFNYVRLLLVYLL